MAALSPTLMGHRQRMSLLPGSVVEPWAGSGELLGLEAVKVTNAALKSHRWRMMARAATDTGVRRTAM